MTFEEYAAQQRLLIAGLVAVLYVLLSPFRLVGLGPRDWTGLLAALYPHVEQARRESAELAREFYDSERRRHTDVDRHPVDLAGYRFSWFAEAMQAIRSALSRPNASEATVARAVAIAVKEVENGGRHTLIRAVESDPQARAWARVAGRDEKSCAFCTMMISRGPVYGGARGAGLGLDDTSATDLWRRVESARTPQARARAEAELDALMTRWHPFCDCRVVPVFDRADWPGRDAYRDAERLWREATRGHRGIHALNALRRALDARQEADEDLLFAA